MKQFIEMCPDCKHKIIPLRITKNTKRILRFLSKSGGAFNISMIGKQSGIGNFSGAQLYLTINSLWESGLISDIADKNSKHGYYKITPKGRNIVSRI